MKAVNLVKGWIKCHCTYDCSACIYSFRYGGTKLTGSFEFLPRSIWFQANAHVCTSLFLRDERNCHKGSFTFRNFSVSHLTWVNPQHAPWKFALIVTSSHCFSFSILAQKRQSHIAQVLSQNMNIKILYCPFPHSYLPLLFLIIWHHLLFPLWLGGTLMLLLYATFSWIVCCHHFSFGGPAIH